MIVWDSTVTSLHPTCCQIRGAITCMSRVTPVESESRRHKGGFIDPPLSVLVTEKTKIRGGVFASHKASSQLGETKKA